MNNDAWRISENSGIKLKEWGSPKHVSMLPHYTNDTRPEQVTVGALILNTDDESVEVYTTDKEWQTIFQMDGLLDLILTIRNSESDIEAY